MPARPNQPDPSIAGARRATDRHNNQGDIMIAADIQASESFELKPGCETCNAYTAERITIPNSVIMDAVAAPAVDESGRPLQGEPYAKLVAKDDRITARTAAQPKPGRPSHRFTAAHIMNRAVDMRNAGLIPFSPFGAFVNEDGLRDRPSFTEWLDRYLAELPDSSTLDAGTALTFEHDADPTEPVLADHDATVAASTVELPADDRAATIIAWIGDDRQRAEIALGWETDRSRPRKSVVKHAESVL